jgi:hypothetical protein
LVETTSKTEVCPLDLSKQLKPEITVITKKNATEGNRAGISLFCHYS